MVPPGLDTFSQVAGNYQSAAADAVATLTPYAQHLLMALFAIELIYTACLWSLAARSGYEILEQLCRRGMAIGLIYWLLTNAVSIFSVVFSSFQQLGERAIGVPNLSAPGILGVGLQMAAKIFQSLASSSIWLGILKGDAANAIILPILAAIIIVIAFTIVAAWYLLTFIEMYTVTGGGVVLIALGGSSISGAIFQRVLSKVISLGIRIMFLILTLGVGMKLANGCLAAVQSVPAVTPDMLFYLIANAVMLLITVLGVPYMASSLAGDSVSFGLAQAFEATWLAGTIASGVQMGLRAAKYVATINPSRARTTRASAAREAVQQTDPGPTPNYPPPSSSAANGGPNHPSGPPLTGPSGAGSASLPPPSGSSGKHKTHVTLDASQFRVVGEGNGNGNSTQGQ
jgi:P-type conjugative transfer protein TrbL